MKFVSIDVGIKNLSFCLFETNNDNTSFSIIKWDNIDLTEQSETKCMEYSKNELCGKPAKFIKVSKCYCLKHAKKMNFLIPSPELSLSYLNKQKIINLYAIADKYKIIYEKPSKKLDLIHSINEFSNSNCFDIIPFQPASKVNLVTIGKNIQNKFNTIFLDHISSIELIIIENQIGPLANKMKTIQGMLAQYFIMKNNFIKIEFISSSNKLKDFLKDTTKKTDYKERKQLGIQYCLETISKDIQLEQWVNNFKKHSKKDDLSDCFLQGLWYINHKINIKN